jgi:hypothetical protein
MFDKNYFLERMNAGESLDDIGKSVADMMNEAKAEYEAQAVLRAKAQKEEELKAHKMEIAESIAGLFVEYAELACPDVADLLGSAKTEDLVTVLDESLELAKNLRGLADYFTEDSPFNPCRTKILDTAIPARKTIKAKHSDDDILSEFIKIFN